MLLINPEIIKLPIAVTWSVESLPSNTATRVRFSAGSGILIPILGLGVCPLSSVLSYAVSGGGPDIVLAIHSRRPALVYLSSVLIHRQLLLLRHLTHGHFSYTSWGGRCKS